MRVKMKKREEQKGGFYNISRFLCEGNRIQIRSFAGAKHRIGQS